MIGRTTTDWLARLHTELLPIAIVGSKMRGVDTAGFKKRPGIPIEDLVAQPTAADALFGALDRLLEPPESSAVHQPMTVGDSASGA